VAYTQAQLEAKIAALEGAFDRQQLSVDFADRRVTYRSFDEIEQAINYYKRLLGELGVGRPRQMYGVTSKGFGCLA